MNTNTQSAIPRKLFGGLTPGSILVLLTAVVILFLDLGVTSLPSQDDAYHAQTAKEMLQSGNFIAIQFGGNISFQSSPLPNWLTALSYTVFGVNEYAARLPSALCALLTILAVFLFARRRFGEVAAISAVFILMTSSLFIRYARHAMTEAPLTFFFTLAVLAAYKAVEEKPVYFLWFGFFTGLAILTKSAMGLLPAMVVVVWFLLAGRLRLLINPFFLAGSFIVLAVAASWYAPAWLMYGEVFTESHFGAYLGTHAVSGHHAGQGLAGFFHYFIWLPIQYLPWTIALVPALFLAPTLKERRKLGLLLLTTVLLPVLLLSLVTTKYTRYLTIIFPAAAVLIVAVLLNRLSEPWRRRLLNTIYVLCLLFVLVPVMLPFSLSAERNDEVREIAPVIISKAPVNSEVLNFRLDHWQYQSPLLFYSGYPLSPLLTTIDEVEARVRPGEFMVGLTTVDDYLDLIGGIEGEYRIETLEHAGDLVCFSLDRMSLKEWYQDFETFDDFIRKAGGSNRVVLWDVAADEYRGPIKNRFGLHIITAMLDPRSAFRRMAREGADYGVTWRYNLEDLTKAAGVVFDVRIITIGNRLLLFTARRVEESGR